MRGLPRLFQIAVFVRIAISLAITPAYGETESVGTCVGREVLSKLDSDESAVFSQLDLSELKTKSPELYRFIHSKAIGRIIKTQPAPYKMIENIIALATHQAGETTYIISEKEVDAFLTVKRESQRLVIRIHSVSLKQPNATSKLDYGKRNDSLSMGFPRLLAAISTGIDRQVEADPSLQKITLVGSYVINSHLADQLKRFGFVSRIGLGSLRSRPKNDTSAFLAFNCDVMTQFLGGINVMRKYEHGSSPVVVKSIKGAAATTAAVVKIRSVLRNRNIGHTWQLDFDLVRAANQ